MKIISVASAVPENSVGNDVVESRLGLERGWIERRTGIRRRPTAEPHEATSDLAVRAGALALARAKIAADDVGLLLLATSTPDHLLPPTAPLVAHHLQLRHAGAIDLAGACTGFIYALVLGDGYGQSMRRPVLIIAANLLTRRVNPLDAATVSLFSDGAGAVVLAPGETSHLLGSYLGADGSAYDAIGIQAGGTRELLTPASLMEGRHLMSMKHGKRLFRNAVNAMAFAGEEAIKAAGLDMTEVDWWIPHQANTRLIRDTATQLGVPSEKTINVVDRYGNSSAATIPIALAHAVESGQVQRGHVLLLTAVGAGMVSAGTVLRW